MDVRSKTCHTPLSDKGGGREGRGPEVRFKTTRLYIIASVPFLMAGCWIMTISEWVCLETLLAFSTLSQTTVSSSSIPISHSPFQYPLIYYACTVVNPEVGWFVFRSWYYPRHNGIGNREDLKRMAMVTANNSKKILENMIKEHRETTYPNF